MDLKLIFKKAVYKITNKCFHEEMNEGITMDDGSYRITQRCKICMRLK